ncbi:MAG TPA: transglycosylase domain-containing protein [Candidatus Limnocylindrales bacterium]|nr:transglycosylase domain-containing protein [Candidatus Limnocylindrales bacterium]
MQTTLARRQRHRRAINRRPTGRGGTYTRRILIAIPIILLLLSVLLAGAGGLFTVAAYNYYASGLPDPKSALGGLNFEQQTIVYDRTGKVELARLGTLRREVVTFDEIPDEMLDATTAIEDQFFWTNPGFDPGAIISAGVDTISGRPRGASTITQQLVRARLLPAAAFEGSTYERKIREIIQSIRLTEAYPGDKGKQDIVTAYLNQNFYGNQTYGVKAAARGYFGKQLKDLTLAEYAILAAIPQSPTKYDLVRNAEQVCIDATPPDPESAEECKEYQLQVPATSDIVVRRNYILDLMKTRSPLSGSRHTPAEYDAAKLEPVAIKPQVSASWRAPHFVWQVREALTQIVCPDDPTDCEDVDTGGYRVTTTLNWDMQKIAEKWVFAAARAPQASNPRAVLRAKKIPSRDWNWILKLRGRNIHNAAAGVLDYRTGEVLAYVGSASYTAKGTKKFQPQFDVLSRGWRQPGSAIKPIDYAIGIDDETLTASTMFMDVVTDFGRGYTPTQADKLERGPVRLRSALQFSLNIPAIKSTLIMGLNHVFERSKDFGLVFPSTAIPVRSMGIGTLETHPIDMLTGYGTIANGGVKMPRQLITKVVDENGRQIWPIDDSKPEGTEVISPQAAYIITDILAGNTQKKVNPYWGEFAIYRGGTRRPAAYKTGTTSDNRDVHAYGYLAPPKDKKQPALAVGVWMGNSNNQPNRGSLSLDSSAPLWSAIMTEVSRKYPIASFRAPSGLVTATVDAFTGLKRGPYTTKTVKELFIKGTVPTQRETIRVSREIDAASGLLWQSGCVGPKVTKGFFNINEVESTFPAWQRANRGWAARAAKGAGVRGGPEGTRTTYFYNGAFRPFGSSWGAPFAPSKKCPLAPKPTPPPTCDPLFPETCLPPGQTGKPTKPPHP